MYVYEFVVISHLWLPYYLCLAISSLLMYNKVLGLFLLFWCIIKNLTGFCCWFVRKLCKHLEFPKYRWPLAFEGSNLTMTHSFLTFDDVKTIHMGLTF